MAPTPAQRTLNVPRREPEIGRFERGFAEARSTRKRPAPTPPDDAHSLAAHLERQEKKAEERDAPS